jgi:archaellum component FlaC
MEEWQKDLIDMIETVADEVEQFFLGVNDMIDAFFEVTEQITEEVQSAFEADIDTLATLHEQFLQDLAEPILEIYWELEDITEDIDPGFPYQVEATLEKNAACVGCSN